MWSAKANYYHNQTICYRDLAISLHDQTMAKKNSKILRILRQIPTVRSLFPEAVDVIPEKIVERKAAFLETLPIYSIYMEMKKKNLEMQLAYRGYTDQLLKAETWNSWVSKFWIFGRPFLVDLPTCDESQCC